jgi:hypothetical protein
LPGRVLYICMRDEMTAGKRESARAASLEHAEEREASVKEADGVRDERALVTQAQHGDEDPGGRVRAPRDAREREHVARPAAARASAHTHGGRREQADSRVRTMLTAPTPTIGSRQ